MKKQELKNKVMELIEQEDFKKYLIREVDKVVDSEYFDIEKEEKESYALAKLVLYLALKREAEQYKPLSENILKEHRNLIKNY